MAKAKKAPQKKASDRHEMDIDPEILQELRDLHTMDIRSYWPACQQLAEELGTDTRSISAAAFEGTPQYRMMWGPKGRPRDE